MFCDAFASCGLKARRDPLYIATGLIGPLRDGAMRVSAIRLLGKSTIVVASSVKWGLFFGRAAIAQFWRKTCLHWVWPIMADDIPLRGSRRIRRILRSSNKIDWIPSGGGSV